MSCYWILDGHTAVQTDDAASWARMFEDVPGRRVGADTIAPGVSVSTVFLGLDHRLSSKGPPLLFETMVFAPDFPAIDERMARCSTWDEAVAQHAAMIAEARAELEGAGR